MNIVIVGPGAIGSLWATHLHQAGHQVALWGTQNVTHWSLQCDEQPKLSFAYNQPDTLRSADLLLITVKAWQVASALPALLEQIADETILLFMHNGMGALDALSDHLTPYPVLLSTTTHGALKPAPDKVLHTGQGQTQIGPFNAQGERCGFVCDVLQHALPQVSWNQHIEHALWQKLAINCAINPLTALEQISNGELAEPRYRARLDAIIAEVAAVMRAEHISVDERALRATIDQVIAATARNRSSMHQDVVHQRQTEIDFINGYVVRKAQQHGLAVPVNQQLYQHIQSLQQSWTQA